MDRDAANAALGAWVAGKVAGKPFRRAALPAGAVVWTAAEVLHAAGTSGLTTGLGAGLLTAVTWINVQRRDGAAGTAALATAAAGAWFTAATEAGPLAGSWHPLTLAAAAGTVIGWRALLRFGPVADARAWHAAKGDWHHRRHTWGLHNAHLLDWQETRLGSVRELDTTETGQLASALAGMGSHLPERIAQAEGLHPGRVTVTVGGIGGRIRIAIRERDPWARPIPHPLTDRHPEMDLSGPCSVKDPLVIGMDPESGAPLLLTVWDRDGAKNIFIHGIRSAGKTVVQNDVRERITACPDAMLFDLNTGKALEDAEWEPACDLAAVGQAERNRALGVLRIAHSVIDWRAVQPRDTAVHQPTEEDPLILIDVDEMRTLASGGDQLAALIRDELDYIAQNGRSESVALLAASQRAVAAWMGGASVRALIDIVLAGKVNRESERNHLGDFAQHVPDMTAYGAGQPGVWAVVTLDGHAQKGRAFNLESPLDIRRMAHERAGSQPSLPAELVDHLGPLYAELKGWDVPVGAAPAATAAVAEENGSYFPVTQGSSPVAMAERPGALSALDAELTAALPADMLAQMQAWPEHREQARADLAEADRLAAALPAVDPAVQKAFSEERWRQIARETEIPPDIRDRLMFLLAAPGMSSRGVAETNGVSRHQSVLWLNRLRFEGIAEPNGLKGRAGRWILSSHPPQGDAQ